MFSSHVTRVTGITIYLYNHFEHFLYTSFCKPCRIQVWRTLQSWRESTIRSTQGFCTRGGLGLCRYISCRSKSKSTSLGICDMLSGRILPVPSCFRPFYMRVYVTCALLALLAGALAWAHTGANPRPFLGPAIPCRSQAWACTRTNHRSLSPYRHLPSPASLQAMVDRGADQCFYTNHRDCPLPLHAFVPHLCVLRRGSRRRCRRLRGGQGCARGWTCASGPPASWG